MKKNFGGVVRGNCTVQVAGNPVWRDGAMTTPLLRSITAAVHDTRSRAPDRAGLSSSQLGALEAIAGARTALAALVGRLRAAGMNPKDAESLVVTAAFEAIATGEANSAETLVAATWRRCRAELRRERSFAARHLWATLADATALVEEPPDEDVLLLLAWAVDAGVVSGREAELIAVTRLSGHPVARLAAERGVPASTLASMRRRAEERLGAVLRCDGAHA